MDNQLTGNAFKRDLKRIGVSIKNMISLTRSMSQLLISSLLSKFCLFCLGLKTIKLIWILNNLLITYWPGIKLSVSETPYSRFFQESRFEKRIMLDMLVSSAKKTKQKQKTGTFKILMTLPRGRISSLLSYLIYTVYHCSFSYFPKTTHRNS